MQTAAHKLLYPVHVLSRKLTISLCWNWLYCREVPKHGTKVVLGSWQEKIPGCGTVIRRIFQIE